MKNLLTATLICVSLNAFSALDRTQGEWGSGGGNALVCFESATYTRGDETLNVRDEIKRNNYTIPNELLGLIQSIEMFDLYEAKKPRGIDSPVPEIIQIEDDEKIYEYIDRVGRRFENTVYFMQGLVEHGKELLPDSRLVFHDFAVEYQNDLGSVTLPGGNCVISTMAAQVNYNGFFEAHIDARLFYHPKHSKLSQATLILHELIYAVGRKYYKQTDSGGTRNIVRQVMSYHPSITEGNVSKSLYDLGYVAGTEWRPSGEYALSNIVQTLLYPMFEDNRSLMQKINLYFKRREGSRLRAEIIETYEKEFGEVSESPDTFKLASMVAEGVGEGQNADAWSRIRVQWEKEIQKWQREVEETVSQMEDQVFESLKANTLASTEDLATLKKFVSDYYGVYRENLWGDWLVDAIWERSSRKAVSAKIMGWTSMEICEVTNSSDTNRSDDVVMQQPRKNSNQECYGPLKLNNLIPRE